MYLNKCAFSLFNQENVESRMNLPVINRKLYYSTKSRQVMEVRHWMTMALAAGPGSEAYRLLALVGPPGCAKSTMVRVLAEDMGVELTEWQVRRCWKCTGAAFSTRGWVNWWYLKPFGGRSPQNSHIIPT